jgi:Gpi18-like mannosyltransferase
MLHLKSNINKALNRWKEAIAITLTLKIILFSIAAIINFEIDANIFEHWLRWDSYWYLTIAKDWYQPNGKDSLAIVFFPLYPLTVRFFNLLLNNFEISAVFVSLLFSLTASIALFELVLLDFKKNIALKSVWFLSIFPTAYFLQAAYSESLFLTLSILSIYGARINRSLSSSILGLLSTATRINGILLLPILISETKTFKGKTVAILLVPLGFIFYLGLNYQIFNDPLYFSKVLSLNWYKNFALPWVSIENLIYKLSYLKGEQFFAELLELVFIILIGISAIFVYFKIRRSYGAYMILNLLLFTSTSFILSTPRYALILFPIYIALSKIENKLITTFISLIFITLLFYYTILFTEWRWAF